MPPEYTVQSYRDLARKTRIRPYIEAARRIKGEELGDNDRGKPEAILESYLAVLNWPSSKGETKVLTANLALDYRCVLEELSPSTTCHQIRRDLRSSGLDNDAWVNFRMGLNQRQREGILRAWDSTRYLFSFTGTSTMVELRALAWRRNKLIKSSRSQGVGIREAFIMIALLSGEPS